MKGRSHPQCSVLRGDLSEGFQMWARNLLCVFFAPLRETFIEPYNAKTYVLEELHRRTVCWFVAPRLCYREDSEDAAHSHRKLGRPAHQYEGRREVGDDRIRLCFGRNSGTARCRW